MSNPSLNLLLVEDNPGDVRLFKEFMKSPGSENFHLEYDSSLDSCLKRLNRSDIDIILLDLSLPDATGLDTLKQVHQAKPKTPVVILTGNQDPALAVESLKNGAQDYLIKGQIDSELLVRSVRYAMERSQLFQKIQEERQRYELVAMGSNDGLWDWDLLTEQIYFSPRWKNMLGYSDNELAPHADEWLKRVHPDDVAQMTSALAEHLGHQTSHFINEHRLRHKDGSYRWVLSRGIAVFSPENKPIRMAGSFTDITRHKQLEQDLARQAYYDPLTKMPNRLMFTDELKRAFAHFQRNPRYLFAILFLDVDGFKQVNDSFGHPMGDVLLAEFGKRLKSCLRPSDFLARVGGDEFNVLLEDLKNSEEAITVAERILEALRTPFTLSGQSVVVTTSIGIAYSNWDCSSADDLVKGADNAMYQAKQAGKARYKIFDKKHHSQMGFSEDEIE